MAVAFKTALGNSVLATVVGHGYRLHTTAAIAVDDLVVVRCGL